MKIIKRVASPLSAALLAATLSVPVAVGGFVLASTPAYAQTALSSAQLSDIQTSLAAALQAAQGNSEATEAAIDLLTEKGFSQAYGARFLKRHIVL